MGIMRSLVAPVALVVLLGVRPEAHRKGAHPALVADLRGDRGDHSHQGVLKAGAVAMKAVQRSRESVAAGREGVGTGGVHLTPWR